MMYQLPELLLKIMDIQVSYYYYYYSVKRKKKGMKADAFNSRCVKCFQIFEIFIRCNNEYHNSKYAR